MKLIEGLADRNYPVACHWDVTAACNAKCGFCYIDRSNVNDLPTESMLRIADLICENGVLYLIISGGEPFLRKDILVILKRLIQNEIFWITILTNGTILSKEHRDFLTAHRSYIQTVQMSAFSHHPEIHDRYMGIPGALGMMTSNGCALRDAGIMVRVAINVFDFNVREIEATRVFFERLGFSTSVSIMKTSNAYNRANVTPSMSSFEFFVTCLKHMNSAFVDQFVGSLYGGAGHAGEAVTRFCDLKTTFMVDPAGDVFPCVINRSVKLGNILRDRIIHDMRQNTPAFGRLSAISAGDMHGCVRCRFFHFCSQCIAENYLENGDYLEPSIKRCNFARAVEYVAQTKSACA